MRNCSSNWEEWFEPIELKVGQVNRRTVASPLAKYWVARNVLLFRLQLLKNGSYIVPHYTENGHFYLSKKHIVDLLFPSESEGRKQKALKRLAKLKFWEFFDGTTYTLNPSAAADRSAPWFWSMSSGQVYEITCIRFSYGVVPKGLLVRDISGKFCWIHRQVLGKMLDLMEEIGMEFEKAMVLRARTHLEHSAPPLVDGLPVT